MICDRQEFLSIKETEEIIEEKTIMLITHIKTCEWNEYCK